MLNFVMNPQRSTEPYTAPAISKWAQISALPFHQGISSYHPTPLRSLSGRAAELGVTNIWVKDESQRFGLNSFKGLGGSYAIAGYLCDQAGIPMDQNAFAKLCSPEIKNLLGQKTFITATDGNHGRGVAWAAKQMGHRAVVYMPEGTVRERVDKIQKLGASALVLQCNYDDAVRCAARDAEKNGWILVQDTAWAGYEAIPKRIMEGYTTLAGEIEDQLNGLRPTHLFLQAGVGSMAGAVAAYFSSHWKNECPTIVVVESDQADCHFRTASANDGKLHSVTGSMNSMMAGLCCGEVNPVSWEILRQCTAAFISCTDEDSASGMRLLGHSAAGDPVVVSGESGAVTMGAFAELMKNPAYAEQRDLLKLNRDSRILLISTEGATDEENYERIMQQ